MSDANRTAAWCGTIDLNSTPSWTEIFVGPSAPPLRSMAAYCSDRCRKAMRHTPAEPAPFRPGGWPWNIDGETLEQLLAENATYSRYATNLYQAIARYTARLDWWRARARAWKHLAKAARRPKPSVPGPPYLRPEFDAVVAAARRVVGDRFSGVLDEGAITGMAIRIAVDGLDAMQPVPAPAAQRPAVPKCRSIGLSGPCVLIDGHDGFHSAHPDAPDVRALLVETGCDAVAPFHAVRVAMVVDAILAKFTVVPR